jgi:hypothetical protein
MDFSSGLFHSVFLVHRDKNQQFLWLDQPPRVIKAKQ